MRRKRSRIQVFELAWRKINRMAHRTFATTNVRSSESGALCVNQSTSRRITSAISVAEASWCCSISFISRVVPKNWLMKLIEQHHEASATEIADVILREV